MTPASESPSGAAPASDEATSTVIAFCRGRDVPCPCCGYNLRDAGAARCPECGQELVMRLDDRRGRERLALWLSTAWCTTLGAAGIGPEAVAWYFNHWRPPHRWSAEDVLLALLLGSMLVYGVAGLIALLRTRRRAMPNSGRWLRVGWLLWAGLAVGLAYYAASVGLAIMRIR